ncbi:MAG: hypothetical protein ACTSUE_27625 [Promethearchaeota archaeon]
MAQATMNKSYHTKKPPNPHNLLETSQKTERSAVPAGNLPPPF